MSVNLSADLRNQVIDALSGVIDPETGIDVIRMRLVEDVRVDDAGVVHYVFRPSSPFCPLAVSLALSMRDAVAAIDGVMGQQVEVVDYVRAAELTAMLRESART
jgi:metal-sulfur cluster biosynthetic enzyme